MAHRSILRRIAEKDDTAARAMVLCVFAIQRIAGGRRALEQVEADAGTCLRFIAWAGCVSPF